MERQSYIAQLFDDFRQHRLVDEVLLHQGLEQLGEDGQVQSHPAEGFLQLLLGFLEGGGVGLQEGGAAHLQLGEDRQRTGDGVDGFGQILLVLQPGRVLLRPQGVGRRALLAGVGALALGRGDGRLVLALLLVERREESGLVLDLVAVVGDVLLQRRDQVVVVGSGLGVAGLLRGQAVDQRLPQHGDGVEELVPVALGLKAGHGVEQPAQRSVLHPRERGLHARRHRGSAQAGRGQQR